MTIRFKKLTPTAKIPQQAHTGDAGLDLYCSEGVTIYPGQRAWVPTGIAWEPLEPAVMFVRPRSSMCKLGIDVTEGTIDAGYRGQIIVQCINNGTETVMFDKHHRIAQGVVVPLPAIDIVESDELTESTRGTNGFGSTGK